LVVPSHAFVISAPDVPVDRLVHSAEKVIAQHPEADQAHYTLGRIHFVAFRYAATMLPVFLPQDDRLPSVEIGPVDWNIVEDLNAARRQHASELALHDVGIEGRYVPTELQKAYSKALTKRQKQLERIQWVPATGGKEFDMLAHAYGHTSGPAFKQWLKRERAARKRRRRGTKTR